MKKTNAMKKFLTAALSLAMALSLAACTGAAGGSSSVQQPSTSGNGSGSYTFSTWEAEENLCHNWSLLADALEEFGYDAKLDLEKGAEHYDVTIRCALLGRVLDELLEEAGITEDDKRFQCNRNEED